MSPQHWIPCLGLTVLFAGCVGDSPSPAPEPVFTPVLQPFADGSVAGNPEGHCQVPAGALPVATDSADRVVGNGTRASCTADAVRRAVAHGGKIRFDCGPDTVTIVMDKPAKVFNDSLPDVVLDGGGKITLSGGGSTRILYMNTCDSVQHWTTPHCQDQATPRLTLQNLTFVDGNSVSEAKYDGGGAVYVRGGVFRVVNCRFYRNQCAKTGPDVGGGAIRAFSQYGGQPVHVSSTTFGSDGNGNVGSNGGAISSIGVSWSIWNSLFIANQAVGYRGNPADPGTEGGGSGGAIYSDGNSMNLSICGSDLERNQIRAYGPAIFYVLDDHDRNHNGLLRIVDSRIAANTGGGGVWQALPGISMHDDTRREIVNSSITGP